MPQPLDHPSAYRRSPLILGLLSSSFFLAASLIVVLITFYQQFVAYNPIPVWDMQEGYLGFLEKINAAQWSAWVSPHNEHRIFFSRLLFWMDNALFHGTNVFLIACNSIAIAINVLLLCVLGLKVRQHIKISPLIISWCFLLCQGENITWAFQTQFHFAYMFPLLGLYLLTTMVGHPTMPRAFLLVAIGLFAIGTMGNGVIALPLFLALALALRLPARILVALAAGNVVAFSVLGLLHDSSDVSHIGDVLHNPAASLAFFLNLLGSPFFYLLGRPGNHYVVGLMGALFVLLVARNLWVLVRADEPQPRGWALTAFTGYVMASYAGATVSRLNGGLDLAVTPHYTTPAILGWAAVALTSADWIERLFDKPRGRAVMAVAALGLIAFQWSSIAYFSGPLFEERVAFLGLAMGVDDQGAQKTLTAPEFFRQIKQFSEPAYLGKMGYFQAYPYRGIRRDLSTVAPLPEQGRGPACSLGPIQNLTTTDPHFERFETWIDVPTSNATFPDFVRLQKDDGQLVGFGLIRSRWIDRWEQKLNHDTYRLKVEGYSKTDLPHTVLLSAGTRAAFFCDATAVEPDQLLLLSQPALRDANITVGLNAVRNLGAIRGLDGLHTNLCAFGLRVLGTSGAGGDADTGRLELALKPGDSFLYRSGPTGGHQVLSAEGHPDIPLPVTGDAWNEIVPSPAFYGDADHLDVVVEDRGTGWGEWSAIAVKTDGQSCF